MRVTSAAVAWGGSIGHLTVYAFGHVASVLHGANPVGVPKQMLLQYVLASS